MSRIDGREVSELRPVRIEPGFLSFAEGSVLMHQGQTRVLCAVTVEERVPRFLKGQGRGWVTAEYSMLPRSTLTRTPRETTPRGRSQEIQRLIGRSLRSVTDLNALGERTLVVDCDVIEADGGTRCASITGSYVALALALRRLHRQAAVSKNPLKQGVAAVSVGVVRGDPVLDLCYDEDVEADVDFNVVMTEAGEFVELQGTAEGEPFDRAMTNRLLDLARDGIAQLLEIQREVLAFNGS